MLNKKFKEQRAAISKLEKRVGVLEREQRIPKPSMFNLMLQRTYKIRDIVEQLLAYLELEIKHVPQRDTTFELLPKTEIDEE